ncbi:TIGR02594 family protein [Aquimarina sp. MMG016]|nr:TIGR02594 family protein [Aquimarina sp. MMG016]
MVKKYHNYCNVFDKPKTEKKIEDQENSWCSSFVSWCLDQTDYKGAKSAGSQSVLWKEGKLFKRIEEPEFGCIVVFTNYVKSDGHQNAKGHITFLYGRDTAGDLICLGGNQGQRIKFSRYFEDKNKVNSTFKQRVKGYGKVLVEQKFQGFFLPKNYPENNGKELQIVNLKKLNDQLAGKAVKSNTENESTL